MEGLILLRYHPNTSKKAIDRWELVELLIESNRELRAACQAVMQINMDYQNLLDGYVDYETNKVIRSINQFYIDLEYDWKFPRAVKKFSKIVENLTFQ
jgi:hypothetical protein